jgi:hypothetical protein
MQAKPSKAKLPQQIIYAGILSGALLFGPKWGGFWAFTQATLGGVIGVAGLGQLKRHEEGKEVPDSPWGFIKGGVTALGEEYEEAREIVIARLPEPLAELVQVTEVVGIESESKLRDLHKYSLMIVSKTGGGKTWFQHQSVMLSLQEQARGGTLRVLDRSYGKRGFRWNGLPRGRIVFTDVVNDLPRLLDEAIAIRKTRIQQTQDGVRSHFPAYILHLTELNESMTEYQDWYEALEEDERAGVYKPKTIISKIGSLLFDGHGYQMFVRVDAQSLAVGETDINQAKLAQMNVIVRGPTAINVNELRKVLAGDAKLWADKVAAARKATGDDHISLAIIEGKPTLILPPDLASATTITIADGAEQTQGEAAAAWALGYTETINAANSPTEAFTLLKDHMPEGYRKQSSSNPYYLAIKALKESES